MESIPLGTCKMWSLYTGGLYVQVVFRVGLTVCYCFDLVINVFI